MSDSTVPGWIRKFVRDRFIWFLIAGAGLFAVHAYTNDQSTRIRVDDADMAMLAGRWQTQTGIAPTADEMTSLVDYHVREEILAREARRLGLDRDDAILRRRLVQKMELLIRDRYEPPTASEDELRSYFDEHAPEFQAPSRVGFRHIFLGAEENVAPGYVAEVEARLAGASDPDAWRRIGKPFMLARQFGPLDALELSELFGRDFAETMLAIEKPSDWLGPVRSAYGLHLVQVLSASPQTAASFDGVRNEVETEFRAAQIEAHEADAWRELRARYRVSTPTPPQ